MRVQGAISGLHAVDARYHDDCRVKFMPPHSVHVAATHCQGTSVDTSPGSFSKRDED